MHAEQNDAVLQREAMHLNPAYLHQQIRASGQAGDGTDRQQSAFGSFHWTQLMPPIYTTLLILMSCLLGYFTVIGGLYFLLFILHSFAYYAFRGKSRFHIMSNCISSIHF